MCRRGLLALTAVAIVGCVEHRSVTWPRANRPQQERPRSKNLVFQGALRQLDSPAQYDASYVGIGYPNGDVPSERGACSDVVVRAMRHAGLDLQKLVHEDVKRGRKYPGIKVIDRNIDHRRVPNIATYLARYHSTLTNSLAGSHLSQWKPGDIVWWKLQNDRDHIGVVSDTLRPDGVPLVIHNIWQVAEEDALDRWRIVGHYRVLRPTP